MLEEMLLIHLAIQQTHARDPRLLSGPELAEFVRNNALALIDSMVKTLDEVNWSPWTPHAASVIPDRDRYLAGLVETWHFMMNLMFAGCGDVSAEDLAHAFTDAYVYRRDMSLRRDEEPEEPLDPGPMIERIEMDGLVLPCSHIVERPERNQTAVTCPCGARWMLTLVEGGKAWNAVPVS